MEKLSCYILTKNSARYLEQVIAPLNIVVDDLLIVDSGSTDDTKKIAEKYNARFVFHEFKDFKSQRNFALECCENKWVLNLDSDEVPDEQLIHALKELKKQNFEMGSEKPEAYRIPREWIMFGRRVHAFYPVSCPDYPIRLFRKDKVSFKDDSNLVHESPSGYTVLKDVSGTLTHYSCDSLKELKAKLDRYTSLAAQDLRARGVKSSWRKIVGSSFASWFKWYIRKGSWKDGKVGVLLGWYAFEYSFQKYFKLKSLVN
ncbi:MAG: glycosyltransferase family 2 protein [Proteobacteria bacterium]|nr:glycosyltransferase family 2 protein [Pseudomonadota bacterium]